MGIFRVKDGDVILTRDTFNLVLGALADIGENFSAEKQAACRAIADNLAKAIGE